MLIPLKIPPGIYRNGTQYQAAGRWYDASLMRFYERALRPVGGWRRPTATPVGGKARGMFPWRDYATDRFMAIGCHNGCWIYNGGAVFPITPAGFVVGRPDSFPGVGYGYGPYSAGPYGRTTVTAPTLDATTWSFDNWGQYLVGCSNFDGTLYQWNLETETPMEPIPNAPTHCQATMVTAERYQFALGADGNPRKIMWSDQEDNTTWAPASTNTAGDIELQTNGRIKTGRRMRGENLIWTDTDLHTLEYQGPPFIYSVRRAGGFCGIAGPNAVAVIESGVAWMGTNGFFVYDGAMRSLDCEVSDYVFGNINLIQGAKFYAGHLSTFGEVWWFYCSAASKEVDRYVVWNYRENHWAIGQLGRTCWADAGVFPYPMGVDANGYVYEHEYGYNDNGADIKSLRYAVSGPVELGNGDQVYAVRQVVPDAENLGECDLRFKCRFTPEGTEYNYGPYSLTNYTDARFTGRQVAMEVRGTVDSDFRVGTMRLDAAAGGRR